jgi:hypothetical protein
MKKGKDDQPCPDEDQHSGDKRTRFWTLNNAFLNKSSGKDPNPNKQQKYVEVYIHVWLEPESQKRKHQKDETSCGSKRKSIILSIVEKKEHQKEAEERLAFRGHVIR